MTSQDLSARSGFDEAVREMLESLCDKTDGAASLTEVTSETAGRVWRVTPTNSASAEFEVDTFGHDSVSVEIAGAVMIELWESRSAEETLSHLEDVCRSIIEGRLSITRKVSSSAAKYRLVLRDGQVEEGSRNWLVRMPWNDVETTHYRPYRDPA